MTHEEAIEILRDTPIDIRSTREDDIHTLYATAQGMAIEALQAEPVKHGEWKYYHYKDINNVYVGVCECTVCKQREYSEHKYCPNCGAKMDKD